MKQKSKWLYRFEINREVDKKVTEKKKDEEGQEIEVTKTVKETKPIKFFIKKPNRRLYDEAELFYGVKMSEGIKAGLLTRNLLSKRYEDDGGAFSEAEKERYSTIYMEIYAKEAEYQRLQVNLDNKPQELKDRIGQDILLEISELRRELIEIENSQANIFDQTVTGSSGPVTANRESNLETDLNKGVTVEQGKGRAFFRRRRLSK